MTGPEDNYSRLNRKKGLSRTNTIMNILIAVVVILIIITASFIFFGGDSENKVVDKDSPSSEETKDEVTNDKETEKTDANEDDSSGDGKDNEDKDSENEEEDSTLEEDESESDDEPGVVTYESSDDAFVTETIINTGWKPIGTKQTGEHTSVYQKDTIDWNEKLDAIAYATGLPVDSMRVLWMKNGGGPQKSIGIVSSSDESEKYRVHLEWIDEEGWQPTKMDVLNTLNFNYKNN